MKTKTQSSIIFAFVILAIVFFTAGVSAAVLSEWTLTSSLSPSNIHSGLSAGVLTGVGTNPAAGSNGASASGWPTSGISSSDYYQITLTAGAGTSFSFNEISFVDSRSDQGPTSFSVQWAKNPTFTAPVTIFSGTTDTNSTDRNKILSGSEIASVSSGEVLYIRFFAFDANSSTGTWRLKDVVLEGTVTSTPAPSLQIVQVNPITETQNGLIRVRNNGNTVLTGINLASSGNFEVSFSTNNLNLAPGAEQLVTLTPIDLGTVGVGGKSVTISAQASDGTSASLTMNVIGSFCRTGPAGGNLTIASVDINNRGGGDDDEWKLLDTIEVRVDIENDGNADVRDVIVRLGLFDSRGRNVAGDLEFDNNEERIRVGRIRDGDDATVRFNFRVPASLKTDDYKLAIKAYSDDLGESNECTDSTSSFGGQGGKFEPIRVVEEDDVRKFIAFENILISPSEATCGDRISMLLDVYNIGEDDQDRVRVRLINTELGLNEQFEILNDLDIGDKESVSFEFNVPLNAQDKVYQLRLSSEYDYRNGNYRQTSGSDTVVGLRVLGCTLQPGVRVAAITASLQSNAAPGEELVVRTTITNLQTTDASFTVNVAGYESWASLGSISQTALTLAPGESRDVTVRLNVRDDATGEKTFVIQANSNGVTETREVAVNFGSSSSSGGFSFGFGGNTYLWIIGLVNVILIILIIVVAIRISRR